MKEEFLHYIWKHKLYENTELIGSTNEPVEVIAPGIHNNDSGPDFFNAKIKIGNTVWAGNVEVHIKSSDWFAHNHHTDKSYDNVVLQVVQKHDKEVTRTNGQPIPTLELKIGKKLYNNYKYLVTNEKWVSCQDGINHLDSFILKNWLEKLAIERLEEKSARLKETLTQTNNSWEEAFYIQLARNFGFNLNSGPFEQLAKSLPLSYLAKHKDNLFQTEALLFGQAGFLDDEAGDENYTGLQSEYNYLKRKFGLKPIEKHLWKFLRSRPGNFPTVRIAQFAKLVHNSSALFSKILECESLNDYYKLFLVNPSDYWSKHYQFNKESVIKPKALGKPAIDIILINTIAPFLFIYGKSKGINDLQERAFSLLEGLKAEKNSIIAKWEEQGIKASNALDTQALIQLKNQYCNHKKCLNCQIGNYLIRNRK